MYRATKTLANGNKLTVTVRLPSETEPGCTPAFAVTAEERNPRRCGANAIEACGCMHEAVLEQWPDLADAVALHLSGPDGEPMHAASNGWYWLCGALGGLGEQYHGANGGYTPDECRVVLREHLRLSHAEMADMVNTTHTISRQESVAVAKSNFMVWIEDLRPRWAAQAEAVIAKYRNT